MTEHDMTRLGSETNFIAWATPQLERLSQRHRAAFAATVAERQLGTYRHLAQKDNRLKPDVLRLALDRVWEYVAGENVPVSALSEAQHLVEPLIPDLDSDDAPDRAPLIGDAVSAVYYAIQACLSDDLRNARAAGYCTLDAVSTWLFGFLFPDGIKGTDVARRAQHTIDQHPLMVREFRQMQREMDFLASQQLINRKVCSELRGLWPNGTKSNIDLE